MKNQKNDGSLKSVGERGFLKRFLPQLSSLSSRSCVVPPGDDAVILKAPGNPVLSIDGLTEGTHFRLAWSRRVEGITRKPLGYWLGWKLLGCSLSDLAAMGGADHRWAMIYLGAPGHLSLKFLKDFYEGTKAAAAKWNCTLAGGDTVRAKDLSLVSAVGGDRDNGRYLTRSGAREGDMLCVAGPVGDASVGLRVLEKKIKLKADVASYFVRRFFEHQPLFKQAHVLSHDKGVSSLMDLSDSLGESIHLLCEASKKGAVFELNAIPASKKYRSLFGHDERLLAGGEDYGLLFTASRQALPRLRKKMTFAVIGAMTLPARGIQLFKRGKLSAMPRFFEHY